MTDQSSAVAEPVEKPPSPFDQLAKKAWEVRSFMGRVHMKPMTAEEALIEYAIHFGLTGEALHRQVDTGAVVMTEMPNGKRYSGAGLVEILGSDYWPDGHAKTEQGDSELVDPSGGGVGEGVSQQSLAERGGMEAAETQTTEGPQHG